jgi:hypothetical protein
MLRSLTSKAGRPVPSGGAGRPFLWIVSDRTTPDFRLGAVPFVCLGRSLRRQCLSPQTGQPFLRFTLMVSNCMLSASMKSILPQSVEPMPAAIFRASVA